MNKGIILATTLALSMAANAGLQKEGVKIPVDNKPAVVKHVGKNQTAENGVIELQYKSSETQRDENIEKSIINYLNYNKNQDGKMKYFYSYVDLNGDNKDEIFVDLRGSYISGSGGSTALIIEKENYEVISKFTLVPNSIIISETKTNGWKDIIMPVSGGGIKSFYAKLQFDGKRYPSNPSMVPKADENSVIKGTAIVFNHGIEIE